MRPGVHITDFLDSKRRKVAVTTLQQSDESDLLQYANDLIDEDTFVLLSGKHLTKRHEKLYVKEAIKLMKENKKIHLIARVGTILVSSFEIRRYTLRKSHVGELGISIVKNFRNYGIGKQCLQILIKQAKKMKIRLIVLTCFANNKQALHLYESVGFKQAGVVPDMLFHKDGYVDEVMMYLPLTS